MASVRKKDRLPVYWSPQAGPQTKAAVAPVDEIFYGGTRGGGKSDCAIGRQLRGAVKYGYKWNGIMFRRKYKELKELKRRFDELILRGMPATRRGGDNQSNVIEFHSGPAKGALITLTACENIGAVDDWIGHQFTEICVDEAPQISFIALMLDKLKGSLRSPHGVPGHMFLTGNPGGPGAGALKLLYIDPVPPGTVNRIEDVDEISGETLVTTRVYIHSTLEDNKILVDADPAYKRRLLSIQDPNLRAAWVEGRWDVYIGQAFQFNPAFHVIPKDEETWPIPQHVPIYMTFDWGFGAPFSIGWWWVDDENRVYRFAEWYGWDGKIPNKGARLTDPEIALGILEREKQMGILGRKIIRLSGRDCFNRKPNYMGGGQGPSTADEFRAFAARMDIKGIFGITDDYLNLNPGDPSRELKIRQFRNRLYVTPGKMPMLMVYETCRHFVRTVPSLCLDELNIEDLEDGQEDHCYDEACHICMARPLSGDLDEFQRVINVQKKTEQVRKLTGADRAAAQEFFLIRKQLADGREDPDIVNDPSLDPAVFGMEDLFDGVDAEDDISRIIQLVPELKKHLIY